MPSSAPVQGSRSGPVVSRDGSPPSAAAVPPWADAVVRLLDRAFVIPGTNIPIGLDAILGFIAPGAGDAASAIATGSLLVLAFRLRVPKVILLRMLLNIGIDAVIGAIPFLGDVFDIFHRAGEKNLALLKAHIGQSAKAPGFGDYAVLAIALICIVSLIALPVVVGIALVHFVVGL